MKDFSLFLGDVSIGVFYDQQQNKLKGSTANLVVYIISCIISRFLAIADILYTIHYGVGSTGT